MSKQNLFYEAAVPISLDRHKNLSVEPGKYQFAANVNSIPLTAVEIPHASREYPIVFAGEEKILPVVVLGVENDQNAYISEDGTWSADYVPAFARQYPFVFSLSKDEKTFTLCVDESWAGCNNEERGQRLFDDAGERTPYLAQMLSFMEEYQAHFKFSQVFCQKLKDLDLLEPMQAQFTLPDGVQKSLTGFMAVSREKLKALPEEQLSKLAKTDELELIYGHLFSMNHFTLMLNRATSQNKAKSDDENEKSFLETAEKIEERASSSK